MDYEYADPVSKLLQYRDLLHLKKWPDYRELGLTREHIPDLIRMATSVAIHQTDPDSREWWAPIHAWRALGQLQAEEAIQPLMNLFHEQEELDWALEELPVVYGMIGPKAIPDLARYLTDDNHGVWPRAAAIRGLKEIAQAHPETRAECVAIMTRQLAKTEENDFELNGALVNYLLDLRAVESLDVIRRAYEEEAVDVSGPGELAEVERELLSSVPAFAPVAASKQKVGRNDPCPCGSGKKYKKCCLEKERAA